MFWSCNNFSVVIPEQNKRPLGDILEKHFCFEGPPPALRATPASGGYGHKLSHSTFASGGYGYMLPRSTSASGGYGHTLSHSTSASGGYGYMLPRATPASGGYGHKLSHSTSASGGYVTCSRAQLPPAGDRYAGRLELTPSKPSEQL